MVACDGVDLETSQLVAMGLSLIKVEWLRESWKEHVEV
jgi:hypothetical protein